MTLAVAIGINAGVFAIAGTVLFGGYSQVDSNKNAGILPKRLGRSRTEAANVA
jgi:hypothetical protein